MSASLFPELREPVVGEKWEKNGVSIIVDHVDDKWIYCRRWQGEVSDLARVTHDTWKEQIKGAAKL